MSFFGQDFKKTIEEGVRQLLPHHSKQIKATTARIVNFRIIDNRSGAANDNIKTR